MKNDYYGGKEICDYLINCYDTLPSVDQNKTRRLTVLVDTTASLFDPNRDIAHSLADSLVKMKGKEYAQAVTAILLGCKTSLSHHITLIYNHNIHSNPKDLFQAQNVESRWDQNRKVHRSLEFRAKYFWDKGIDKKLLFVDPSTTFLQETMGILRRFYDEVFPWEWEGQNE